MVLNGCLAGHVGQASPPARVSLQRWDAHRKAAALAHWRRLLAERREAEENLKRCLIRKRVAFRLFRHWYWESFDDDMQVSQCAVWAPLEKAQCVECCWLPAALAGMLDKQQVMLMCLHLPRSAGDAAHHV